LKLPGAFRRFLILMELRMQLWPRSASKSKSSLAFAVIGLGALFAWSVLFGVLCFKLVAVQPEGKPELVFIEIAMVESFTTTRSNPIWSHRATKSYRQERKQPAI
jgi:hypothetical protein